VVTRVTDRVAVPAGTMMLSEFDTRAESWGDRAGQWKRAWTHTRSILRHKSDVALCRSSLTLAGRAGEAELVQWFRREQKRHEREIRHLKDMLDLLDSDVVSDVALHAHKFLSFKEVESSAL